MTLAERLLAVVEAGGFNRLKRVGSAWELWLRDGTLETLDGPTLEDVVSQAEARIARRGQP